MKHVCRTYNGLIWLAFIFCLQSLLQVGNLSAAGIDSALIQTPTGLRMISEKSVTVKADSTISASGTMGSGLPATRSMDSTVSIVNKTVSIPSYKPDPKKSVWYSALCPGLGQLYNRRYWKLPFIGAGVVGVIYAIRWNTKYYNAYTNAYRDAADDDPNTDSYNDLLPRGNKMVNSSYLVTVLSNRQQKYRRSRDLSYMGAVGLYVISMLDAFIDAQLYDFDISPELSVSPAGGSNGFGRIDGAGINVAFRF